MALKNGQGLPGPVPEPEGRIPRPGEYPPVRQRQRSLGRTGMTLQSQGLPSLVPEPEGRIPRPGEYPPVRHRQRSFHRIGMALKDDQTGVEAGMLRAPFPAQPGPGYFTGGQVELGSPGHRAVIGVLHGEL